MTNKRNTLLYLDRDLVNKAKKAGLNLSLVAEEALRSRLPYNSEFKPKTYLMEALQEGAAVILPFHIKELSIADEKETNKKTMSLKPLNVIVGGNGTGKSSIFRLLCRAFRINQPNRLAYPTHMKITVTIAHTQRIEYSEGTDEFGMELNKQCIVTDTLFTRLDKEERLKMLKYLIKTGAQLILLDLEVPSGAEKFNIIKL